MFFTSLLQSNLKVKKFARNIIYYPRTESTSDDIWELYRENKDSTLLVISDYQTKGRGRFNKKWFSSPGVNLTFSFLLKDIYPDNKKNIISLLIPLAIINGVEKFTSIKLNLKWPNDIMYTNKKVGGVLIESKINQKLKLYNIGIGLNVNDDFHCYDNEIKDQATSLKLIKAYPIQREPLLASILNELENLISKKDEVNIIKLWLDNCMHINQNIKFHNKNKLIKGSFIDINNKGEAVIQYENSFLTYSGEIQLI